jgi:hypothetical protein
MKKFRSFGKGVKRALGQEVSSSESEDEAEVVYYRSIDPTPRQEGRASSPSVMEQAVMDTNRQRKGRRRLARQEQARAAQEQASLQRQAAEFTHNFEINEMIGRINEYFGRIDVDQNDPRIRFVIGQIVNAHGLTLHSLSLMRRSRILLSAIGDIAARTGRNALSASDVVYRAGEAVLDALLAAGRLASHGASAVASRLPSLQTAFQYFPSRFSSSQPRALGQRARSPDSFLQVQGPPDLGFNQVRFHAPAFGRQSLPFQSQAPPPPPPPPPASTSAPAVEEEDECSICMNPLRHNVVLTRCNHAFHGACVTPWLNSRGTCPMCRNTNPTPLVPAPAKRQRQGGGGSRKSKSRSRSNPKTRRLRKSRNKSRSKPRKSRKSRKPRSSSRRK